MRRALYILGISLGVFSSCNKNPIKASIQCSGYETDSITYLFLSHPRGEKGHIIDLSVAAINYNQFDAILLGGDLSFESSESEETISALDAIFNFSSENTHWAMGSHDVMDRDLVLTKTLRSKTYYAHYTKGSTFIILDTELDNSSITGDQLDFFNHVMDTVSVSKNIIVVHHKLFWIPDNPELAPLAPSVSNGRIGDCFHCLKENNNFYSDIYPKLSTHSLAGKNVFCIGGDSGTFAWYFHHTTPEGVRFYANGSSYSKSDNYALTLDQSPVDSNIEVTLRNITCLY